MKGWAILFLLCWGRLFAQDTGKAQSIDDAATDYFQHVSHYSVLYYGDLQKGYPSTINHPYLQEEAFAGARLSYIRTVYPDVLLRLDICRDELIVQSPTNRSIVLFPENVDFAELHGYRIIYFQSDALPSSPSSGYYFQLYSGRCKVMEKRNAVLQEKPLLNEIERHFLFSTHYYLFKDDAYYSIKNKRGLLKALSPYKKELKQYISSNRLNYRKNPELLLKKTVEAYEKLIEAL